MQIRPDALAAQLARGLRPLYTVYGDEPLLVQEAADAIRAAARASGCSERQVHTVLNQHFDWSGLLGASQALSLFAERQLIEIRIPNGKPGDAGSKALQRYCEALSDDVVTLVQLPKLDRQQLSSGWFVALDVDHLQDAPGAISTSNKLFDRTALRPIPQIWHDPLSTLSFGDGRIKNSVYAAAPSGAVNHQLDQFGTMIAVTPGFEGELHRPQYLPVVTGGKQQP